jgi:hypothetical protein
MCGSYDPHKSATQYRGVLIAAASRHSRNLRTEHALTQQMLVLVGVSFGVFILHSVEIWSYATLYATVGAIEGANGVIGRAALWRITKSPTGDDHLAHAPKPRVSTQPSKALPQMSPVVIRPRRRPPVTGLRCGDRVVTDAS